MHRLPMFFGFVCAVVAARPSIADDAEKQARIQFEQGVKMYEDGDFEGASIAFARAYELRPSYKILYNVGQVESELKHYARALEAYTEYLEQGASELDDARKKEVAAKLEDLRARVGKVKIEYGENGVTVMIDGERRGATPLLEPLMLDMGSHELSLRKGVEEIYKETFRVAGGQELTLSLNSGAAAARASEIKPTTTASEPSSGAVENAASQAEADKETSGKAPERKKRKWTYVALGLGAVAAIAGAGLGGASMSKESKLEDKCQGSRCADDLVGERDDVKRLALMADIFYGAAAVGIAAGIVLFIVEPRRHEKRSLNVTPSAGPSSAGFAISGRF